MMTPTFADVDEALARGDCRAALSVLESLEVVGEDACYRRDIQAAACADRLGLYPLCEEYATRARAYGDDMADPFALIARAQRRQGLVADAEAPASSARDDRETSALREPLAHSPRAERQRGQGRLQTAQGQPLPRMSKTSALRPATLTAAEICSHQ